MHAPISPPMTRIAPPARRLRRRHPYLVPYLTVIIGLLLVKHFNDRAQQQTTLSIELIYR